MESKKSESNQTKVNQTKPTTNKLQTTQTNRHRDVLLLSYLHSPYLYAYLRAYSFACASV